MQLGKRLERVSVPAGDEREPVDDVDGLRDGGGRPHSQSCQRLDRLRRRRLFARPRPVRQLPDARAEAAAAAIVRVPRVAVAPTAAAAAAATDR